MKEYQDILDDEDSELYETNCDDNLCLHMFTATEKYLGCQGVPKLNISIELECYNKGKECAELITFKKKLKKQNPFRNCFKQEGIDVTKSRIEYPRPRCNIPSKMWLASGKCSDSVAERGFDWKLPPPNRKTECSDGEGFIITHSKEAETASGAGCDCKWGRWSD